MGSLATAARRDAWQGRNTRAKSKGHHMVTIQMRSSPLICQHFDFTGAARGIRTPDPLITNEVLYQLSYCGETQSQPY
jgi:hypothetical protein